MNEWMGTWSGNDVKNRIRDWEWEERKLLCLVYLKFLANKMTIIYEYKLNIFHMYILLHIYHLSYIMWPYPLVHFTHLP